jgi:hypothetical protein
MMVANVGAFLGYIVNNIQKKIQIFKSCKYDPQNFEVKRSLELGNQREFWLTILLFSPTFI